MSWTWRGKGFLCHRAPATYDLLGAIDKDNTKERKEIDKATVTKILKVYGPQWLKEMKAEDLNPDKNSNIRNEISNFLSEKFFAYYRSGNRFDARSDYSNINRISEFTGYKGVWAACDDYAEQYLKNKKQALINYTRKKDPTFLMSDIDRGLDNPNPEARKHRW